MPLKRISNIGISIVIILLLSLASSCYSPENNKSWPDPPGIPNYDFDSDVYGWITDPARSILFEQIPSAISFTTSPGTGQSINIDTSARFQEIDGFGNCLTGGSAMLLNAMTYSEREKILNELFSVGINGIGISYLRISLGASDLSDHVFSYDDMPAGQTDPDLTNFSIAPDEKDLIPVLKEILSINPDIKILASPWSAPVWMKTNNNSIGGSLKYEYYDAYSRYFVKYINTMKDHGITIDAITIQNEPLHDGNNPSMYMTAKDQARFIKENLGPLFEQSGISTKIIIWDHNCDNPGYPMAILSDPQAARYVDGSAFHLYGGDISALSTVHDNYPDKNLYFTEQWVGAPGDLASDLKWHVGNLIIGATRNWSRNVLEWNLASDASYDPHTEGGCDRCLGTVTIDGNTISRNPAYYILAHTRFVRPGSYRIGSTLPSSLPNVAFVTPDGLKVLIVLNNSQESMKFDIEIDGRYAALSLGGGAVGTYIWK